MKFNPALWRGAIVAVFALASTVSAFQWATPENAELISTAVSALAALLAGAWIRPAVTPNAKVLAFVTNPDKSRFSEILPGEAIVPDSRSGEVVEAATTRPRSAA